MTDQQDQTTGVITQAQLDQIWSEQGLEKKMERFWGELIKRGLGAMVMPKYVFSSHMKHVLVHFFVQGKADDHG